MKASIEVIEPRLFAGAVSDEIVASVREAIAERGRCSIVLAGGSTPGSIYRALSKPPRVEEVEWSAVTLYWGDERWVPHTDNMSNFKMTQETLLSQIPEPKPAFFPVDTSRASPADAAASYGAMIASNEKFVPGTFPTFDIVLLGIGEDGHTASLFPGSPLLEKASQSLCAAVEHPEDGKPRITLTPPALLAARRIFFIVKGEGKSDVMKRVLEGNESASVLPSRLFLEAGDRVTFFLDSGAAQHLSRPRG